MVFSTVVRVLTVKTSPGWNCVESHNCQDEVTAALNTPLRDLPFDEICKFHVRMKFALTFPARGDISADSSREDYSQSFFPKTRHVCKSRNPASPCLSVGLNLSESREE